MATTLATNLVLSALAQQCASGWGTGLTSSELEAELVLEPLNLVLVALRLEEGAAAEFPIERLEGIHTVAQLAAVVAEWGPMQRGLS